MATSLRQDEIKLLWFEVDPLEISMLDSSPEEDMVVVRLLLCSTGSLSDKEERKEEGRRGSFPK